MFHAVGICHPIPVKGRVFHKHVCPVLCYRIVPTAEFWFAHPLFFPKYIYSQTNLVYFKRWGWPALLVFFPKRCLVGGIRSTFRQITEIRFSLTCVFGFFKQLISVSATSIFLRSGCWTRLTWVLSVEVNFCLTKVHYSRLKWIFCTKVDISRLMFIFLPKSPSVGWSQIPCKYSGWSQKFRDISRLISNIKKVQICDFAVKNGAGEKTDFCWSRSRERAEVGFWKERHSIPLYTVKMVMILGDDKCQGSLKKTHQRHIWNCNHNICMGFKKNKNICMLFKNMTKTYMCRLSNWITYRRIWEEFDRHMYVG